VSFQAYRGIVVVGAERVGDCRKHRVIANQFEMTPSILDSASRLSLTLMGNVLLSNI